MPRVWDLPALPSPPHPPGGPSSPLLSKVSPHQATPGRPSCCCWSVPRPARHVLSLAPVLTVVVEFGECHPNIYSIVPASLGDP